MSLRDFLRNALPASAKQRVNTLRQYMARPDIDQVVLQDYKFHASNDPVPRLNFLLPRVSAATTFGGIMTGFKLFFGLAQRLCGTANWDVRLVVDAGYASEIQEVLRLVDFARYFSGKPPEIVIKHDTPAIDTRSNDVFVCYNWWTVLNIRLLLRQQQAHFQTARRPLIYLIQDYEPLFYPMSSAHMLARAAFDLDWPVWGIFNSSQLFTYFALQGHRVERHFVVEPVLHDKLRPYLSQIDSTRKRKIILIYGRGQEERNCFSLLRSGLEIWSREYPRSSDWSIRSLGSTHVPIRLAGNRTVQSEGRLPLDEYAGALLAASVGVSLMASPHPSYPPLEMAHFGIRTITNTFTCKDIGTSHENLISLPALYPTSIAGALVEACQMFENDPGLGIKAKSNLPAYTAPMDESFLEEIAEGLLTLTKRG